MFYFNIFKKLFSDYSATTTTAISDNYTIGEYLKSLLDEELCSLIKIDYNKCLEHEKILQNPKFKKLFEKNMNDNNNKCNRTFNYWTTVHYIEKEVIRRWINYIERNIVK